LANRLGFRLRPPSGWEPNLSRVAKSKNEEDEKMVFSDRARNLMIAIVLGIIAIAAIAAGWWSIQKHVDRRRREAIQNHLELAGRFFSSRAEGFQRILQAGATGPGFRDALRAGDRPALRKRLAEIAEIAGWDFAGAVFPDGQMMARIGPGGEGEPPFFGRNPAADLALEKGPPLAGPVVMDRGTLAAETPELARRAAVKVRQTRETGRVPLLEETAGLTLSAAVPVLDGGELLGAVYGGVLLNRNERFVRDMTEMAFGPDGESNRDSGRIAIYYRNLRVAAVGSPGDSMGSNPSEREDESGQPPLGTPAGDEATRRVLLEGKSWITEESASSKNGWVGYAPITDLFGQRVGMVGIEVR
jgi:two-component system NtrC family sensor kinase